MPTAELIEGLPFFAEYEGQRLNRRQWLAATAPQRKADFVQALRDAAVEDALDVYDVTEDEEEGDQ